MNPSDDRVETIFQAALELSGTEEREVFISAECRGDAMLEARVHQLLEVHRDTDGSPLPTTVRELAPRPRPEREGERIGHYKLLQQIGEGGFGTVWMAEQVEPVSRRVALKIIKLGMDTREVIARFEAERQALAMMEHPNIAKVLDAGATDKGRPFFVMELVKGVPITQFCDERQLGTRERLALFGDVCSAINHAHQKGVIHRDIKPSNVMVTLHGDKPVVKVIDFGIAKATQGKLTDKTLFTRYEQFIGTPVYMSPEQASMSGLDIDTRSDIYALGILLYELLTGKPPFDAKSLVSAGYEEMRRIIREVEPPKPSLRLSTAAGEERTLLAKARHIEPEKLGRLVEPDLDWIVMKAIEKDRTRRYETPNAFAQDIKRFLADEPVSATPPSAGYQLRKFARRNKAALRLAAGIAAVLVIATMVSTWQAVRATRAEKKAAAERDAKEVARKDAEDIATFLGEVFQSPNPARDGRTITVAETLDKAAKKLETELAAQPAQRARLQATLGWTYHALGLYREAILLQEKARDYCVASFGKEHPDALNVMNKLGNSYSDAGRWDEALKLREEVLALRRRLNGPEHPDTLTAMMNLTISYSDANRTDEALQMREEVLALRRKVSGLEHPDTLMAMMGLAALYSETGRHENGIRMSEQVVMLERKVNGVEHPHTLYAMHLLAGVYEVAEKPALALSLREEVLGLRRKVLGLEHPDTLSSMTGLAVSYDLAGRSDEALKLKEEVLALRRKASGTGHPYTIWAMEDLANAYEDLARAEKGPKLREEMLALQRQQKGLEHPDTLDAMEELAVSLAGVGRGAEALKLREELLELRRRVSGPDDPYTLYAVQAVAESYADAGRQGEAINLLEKLLERRRAVLGPAHSDTLWTADHLAKSYSDAGRWDEGVTLREGNVAILRELNGAEHKDTLRAMENLARFYAGSGRHAEAIKLREEVLPLSHKSFGPEDAFTLWIMETLADSYGAIGRHEDALKLRQQVVALSEPSRPSFALLRFMILIGSRDYAAAYELLEKTSEAQPANAWLQNELAWKIITNEEIAQRDLSLAEKFALRAIEAANHKDANALDTLARVLFMQGRVEEAIQRQQQAVDVAKGSSKSRVQKTLDSYRQGVLPKP